MQLNARRGSHRRRITLGVYATSVSVAGWVTLAWIISVRGNRGVPIAPLVTVTLAALVTVGEFFPLPVRRGMQHGEIATSTVFAFAMLLSCGLVPTIIAQAGASLAADLVYRRSLQKALFNVAQYTLALAAGQVILTAFGVPQPLWGLNWLGLPGVVAAAAAFFIANNVLTGVAVAVDAGVAVGHYLSHDLALQATTDGALLMLSPAVAVLAAHALVVVPVALVPILSVYRSARISLEKEHQALTDTLTGLPNRVLLSQLLGDALALGRRATILLLDFDRFREVNNVLGHGMGDRLLELVGPRLRAVLGDNIVVARFGGDEFAVLLLEDDAEGPLERAREIRSALEEPFVIEDIAVTIEATVGVALAPEHGRTADELLQHADVALYAGKAAHSGTLLYDEHRDTRTPETLALLGELRTAIAEEQLTIHYQPKVSLRDGSVRGVEALVRWEHPTRGLLMPCQFVGAVEYTGLNQPLTQHLLERAIDQARCWNEAQLDIPIAVNLSARDIDLDLPCTIDSLLIRYGVPPSALEVEITESSLLPDPDRAKAVVAALQEKGIAVTVDDFGTGYSSLAYLANLDLTAVKIDRSFISEITTNPANMAIVRSIVQLGRELNLRVIAEGIESCEQYRALADLGCDEAQGYWVHPPAPRDEIESWLRVRCRVTSRLEN